MAPKKFLFCISLKHGAWIMAFINLIFAATAIFGGAFQLLFIDPISAEDSLNLFMCIVIGIFNIIIGVMLLAAILTGKEKYVLLYLLLELMNLMMITIFTTLYMFQSLFLAVMFGVSIILWYGLHCMYGYYVELAEYNSVKSGVIEISCNTQVNPLMVLPEKAMESTAV